MTPVLRNAQRLARSVTRPAVVNSQLRTFALSATSRNKDQLSNPPRGNRTVADRGPPSPPREEAARLKSNKEAATFLGTTKRLPEFALNDKVVLVTGGARGLGLVQAEALCEAGATVYCLDRLEEPSPDFYRVQKRAAEELGSTLHYRQIDVRDVLQLNEIISTISDDEGRLDGLVAAAGIQQETPALEYTAKDANTMFEVNITGVFMTAQAVAKQMIRHGNGGSMAFIASMSASVANKGLICPAYNASKVSKHSPDCRKVPRLTCSRPGWCASTSSQPCNGMGWTWDSSQHNLAGVHRDGHGGGIVREISRASQGLANAKYVGQAQQTRRVSWGSCVPDFRGEQLHDWYRLED